MYTDLKLISAYSSNTYTFMYLGNNMELIKSVIKLRD